jgi:hypothetical protein
MVSQVLANAILNQKAPDILGSFREGQEFAKGQQVKQLAGEAAAAGGGERLQELIGLDPEVGYALADAIGARNAKELNSFVRDARIVDNLFKSGSVGQAKQFIEQSLATAVNLGQKGDSQRNLLNILNNNGLNAAGNQVNAFLATFEKSKQETSSNQDRDRLLNDLNSDNPDVVRSAEIALKLKPGAGNDTAAIRAATDTTLGGQIVNQIKAESGAREQGSQEVKSIFAPKLAAAIQVAKTKAESEGKVFSDLAKAEAGLPGILDLVANLKGLSNVASSTLGKRGFDVVVRELGFGSTKGGTARAKYIAVVANTLLPLLRLTFGGSFTEDEGEKLLATLGSTNLDANARNAELDAFLESKISQIEGLRAQASTIETKDNTSPPGKFEGFSILSKSK